jgi:D-tyrosyl-tRNA(Tyr) deacylase
MLSDVRAVLQRVLSASVTVDGRVVGAIETPGLLAYVGVTHGDGQAEVAWMARKIWEVRLLRGEHSLSDVAGSVLVVSQFTLYGDARKGNRPAYVAAARPEQAEPLYERFSQRLDARRGLFGAMMQVGLVNDGPVTLLLEVP